MAATPGDQGNNIHTKRMELQQRTLREREIEIIDDPEITVQ